MLLAGSALAVGACGSGDSTDVAPSGVVDVRLSDFWFGVLPDDVPAGNGMFDDIEVTAG